VLRRPTGVFRSSIVNLWVAPLAFYFLAFCLLTYPLILSFPSHFFADAGDGLQNVWNLWWVRKAIVELHTTPWYTTFLHHPSGVSLLGHTLNPFNGFLGLLLQPFLSLIASHNVIVVFSFVVAGLTAFRLALEVTESYWGSIIAGYVFTFSQYHFAHAEGHLQLVALEWIPFFILCWLRLVIEPNIRRAVAASMALLLVALCDYYYLFYCVLAGAMTGAWHAWGLRAALADYARRAWRPLVVFGGATLATSGVLLASLLRLNAADPLGGEHQALAFSLDALALFIPGGHWRFATLTKSYFERLPGNIHESSVYLGLPAVLLSIYVWRQRVRLRPRYPSLYLWFGVMLFFAVMALGPVLHFAGPVVYDGPMPYAALEAAFPSLRLSGVPVRMVVMVTLAASVIVAIGVQALLDRPVTSLSRGSLMVGLAGIVLFVDSWPQPIPRTRPVIPEYVTVLSHLPRSGAVLDPMGDQYLALYYQTIHQMPLADGYVSRLPLSVTQALLGKYDDANAGRYQQLLHRYNVRYVVMRSTAAPTTAEGLTLWYSDEGVKLYFIQ
jgi:hypothetical protein